MVELSVISSRSIHITSLQVALAYVYVTVSEYKDFGTACSISIQLKFRKKSHKNVQSECSLTFGNKIRKYVRWGTALTLPNFCVVLCIVCVYMCNVLLPSGGYPIAFNKYIISSSDNAREHAKDSLQFILTLRRLMSYI